ncbi:MAG: sortase [Ruminococcus sp.]|nr:sortase [Ruminococcus sp.]MBQ1594025.1 sortase [Ruminococcus sp.]MBQ2281058.1 sortase [Ruminococcus sp.]SCX27492.1 sortase A [Ruminococcaceae bacterium P7]
MKSKFGWIILLAGLLCMAAALAVFLHNRFESQQAQTASAEIVAELSGQIAAESEEQGETFPTDNPDRSMPELTVQDARYAGILTIPELELELPVLASFDYDSLQVTPCLYSGTIYRRNMVIGAHNYDAHFGRISELGIGSEVNFTDVENHTYSCEVVNLEMLKPNQNDVLTEKQHENDWDITLFTCNFSGTERITVRCKMKEIK